MHKDIRKGFHSLVLLVIWELWKHRNRVVFDDIRPQAQGVLLAVEEEATIWSLAGATKLTQLLARG